jgi:hypothetical protein
MKKKSHIVIIIFLTFFLSCNNTELENKIKGKWEEKTDPKILFSAATYYFWPNQKLQYTVRYFSGLTVSGRYEIKKNTVHLYRFNTENKDVYKEEEYDSFIIRFISDSVFIRGTNRFQKQVGWIAPK